MSTVAQVLNPQGLDGWYSLGGLPVSGSTKYNCNLQFRQRLRGGKGGFAVLLKQQGERMAKANNTENTDRFRNLSGQRLGTVRQAQQLARQRDTQAADEAQKRRRRKEKIERALKPRRQAVAEPRARVDFSKAGSGSGSGSGSSTGTGTGSKAKAKAKSKAKEGVQNAKGNPKDTDDFFLR